MARYNTTVTKKDGSKVSGYIEDGRSYYDDGTSISAGDSVVDAQGKTWTKGGADTTTSGIASANNLVAKKNAEIQSTVDTAKARKQNTYTAGDGLDSYTAFANLQKQMKEQELARAKANALSSLEAEKQATNEAYKTKINETGTNADIALKNYFENVANRGQTYSGSTSQGEIAHNIARQNNISALQQAQASALADIARRKQLAEQGYIDDLQSANNAIDLQVLEKKIEAEQDANKNALEEAKIAAQYGDYSLLQKLTGMNPSYAQQIQASELAEIARKADQEEAEQKRKDVQMYLDAMDYGALKGLGIDASNLQTEFDSNIAKTKADISNTQSLISSRNEEAKKKIDDEGKYKSTDSSIANYVNRALGKDLIKYNTDTKTYELVSNIEDARTEDGVLTSSQVYSWYKDPIIQKVLLGVYNGAISSAEGANFLRSLGYGDTDITRVKNYTFSKEGE